MGQFKPMVKMETTEPSVELKLKKGGKVVKKADGGMMGSPMGVMPARGGMMGVNAPMRPPLAMRRRAMRGLPSGAGPAGPVGGAAQMQPSMPSSMPTPPVTSAPMKKGGKAEGGKADTAQDKAMIKKAFKQHDMQEHKGGKGTSLKLKHGGKMATGGVVNGQGGFATGGVVNGQGGFATGGVAKSNAGGYKRGGKIKGMMGGGMAGDGMMGGGMMDDGMMNNSMSAAYKKGGATKKAYAAGGTVNSGRPVAMPQGNKRPSPPVRIDQLSGTFKRGGTVKMNGGGSSSEKLEDMSKGAYDKAPKYSRDVEDALNPLGMVKELASKAKNFFMPKKTADSVTETKESVTVTPAKKRGGAVNC